MQGIRKQVMYPIILNYCIPIECLSQSYTRLHSRPLVVFAQVDIDGVALPYEVHLALDYGGRVVWLAGTVGKVIANSCEEFYSNRFDLDNPIEIFGKKITIPTQDYVLQYDEF